MLRGLVASLVPALVLLAVGGLNNALTAAIFVVIGVLADAALGERGSHLAALAGFAAWIIILLALALLASLAGGEVITEGVDPATAAAILGGLSALLWGIYYAIHRALGRFL